MSLNGHMGTEQYVADGIAEMCFEQFVFNCGGQLA